MLQHHVNAGNLSWDGHLLSAGMSHDGDALHPVKVHLDACNLSCKC